MTDKMHPKEPQEPLLQYPCDYPIKVIGNNTQEFVNAITRIIVEHFPNIDVSRMQHTPSANGKFVSISVVLHLHYEHELHQVYLAMKAVPGLQMVL